MMRYPDRMEALRIEAAARGKKVAIIADRVLSYPGFVDCSGSAKPEQHHYGTGGLQQHTWEVVTLCLANERLVDFNMTRSINRDTLFLAALFHDVGKTHDYQLVEDRSEVWGGLPPKVWGSAPHKRNIHHISRSAIIWSKAVAETGLFKDIEDEVLHAILAHHGLREFGSPVAPNSKVAWLLHLCDSISARMDDVGRWDVIVEKGK